MRPLPIQIIRSPGSVVDIPFIAEIVQVSKSGSDGSTLVDNETTVYLNVDADVGQSITSSTIKPQILCFALAHRAAPVSMGTCLSGS